MLHFLNGYLKKQGYTPLKLCPKLETFKKYRHGTSTVASVVNSRPTTAVSRLSHTHNVQLCVPRGGRDGERRADPSVAREACLVQDYHGYFPTGTISTSTLQQPSSRT